MRIQKQKKNIGKTTLVVLASALLLVAVFLLFIYLHRSTPTGTGNLPGSSHKSDNTQSKNIHENPSVKQQTPNTDTPANPTSTPGTDKQKVEMTASENTSNGIVFIRGGVNYPVSEGSCYALLSGPSGQVIRKDTPILQNPESTDCKTISIPVNELSPGQWTFTLYYTSNSYEGTSSATSFSL